MTPYTDLLARLEAATEGSRELDAEIAYAIDFKPDDDPDFTWRGVVERAGGVVKAAERLHHYSSMWGRWIPRYSTSLDAALTLLPAPQKNGLRCRFWLERKPTSEGTTELWFAECRHHAVKGEMVSAPTAALAACKAILRARQSLEERK